MIDTAIAPTTNSAFHMLVITEPNSDSELTESTVYMATADDLVALRDQIDAYLTKIITRKV